MLNEIKFACPYCRQHIACDAAYRDFTIDCPACGNSMVVPHLRPSDSPHPAMVLVASTPSPKRPEPPPIPASKTFAEEQRSGRPGVVSRIEDKTAPHWVLSFIGTVIVLFVQKVNHAGAWPMVACLILGGVLTGILVAKDRRSAGAYGILK